MTLLEIENVTRVYGRGGNLVHALSGVSMQVGERELIAVTGPSGCGKTTLLDILGLVVSPTEGHVRIDGVETATFSGRLTARTRNSVFGYIRQDFALLEEETVASNVELPLLYSRPRISRRRRRDRTQAELDRFGVAELAKRKVMTLSGGQKQRVAIARGLAGQARILLADEPTGALDSGNAAATIQALRQAVASGCAVVIATHNPHIVRECDQVIELKDGRVV